MVPVQTRRFFWHHVVIGAISFFGVATGLFVGCRSAPDPALITTPPVTEIRHLDIALTLVQGGPLSEIAWVYSESARGLAAFDQDLEESFRAEEVARRLDLYLRGTDPVSAEVLLQWARMWNGLAALNPEFAQRASAVSTGLTARLGEGSAATLLVGLLESQLANPNAQEESIRRNLDELYLLEDDRERAHALVDVGEIVRARGDRLALNPVVQQAIAIVPVIESPVSATVLNARLSDLSESLGNSRDVRTLQDRAVSRAEAGLVVSTDDLPAIRRVVETFVARGDRPGIEVIIGNIAPASSRAITFAMLGTAALKMQRPLPHQDYYRRALEIAGTIDDPQVRAVTTAEVVLVRLDGQREWASGAVVADLLRHVDLTRLPQEVRVRVLATLSAAFLGADRPDETTRLRGVIRSAEELSLINVTVAEMMIARGREDVARRQLEQIERIPPPPSGDARTIAYRISLIWIGLEEYDRAITVLLEADRMERARVLSRIPAGHRPNPAAVTDLERLLNS